MKKLFALLLVLAMVLALCACGDKKDAQTAAPAADEAKTEEAKTEETAPAEEVVVDAAPEAAPTVMSYAEYTAAEKDSPVVVETYVQDHQSWWDGKITVYAQDPDGAYFIYNMACSEADAAKLVPGQKIRVSGYKSEWAGEIEIIDAAFELLDAEPWFAEPVDITEFCGTLNMVNYQNRLVSIKGAKVEEYKDKEGNLTGAAVAYKDPENKTDDLYFQVTVGETTYEFCVEFYLRGSDSEVYKAVEALQVGDTVDLEGYLYWYEGPNLHTTAAAVR